MMSDLPQLRLYPNPHLQVVVDDVGPAAVPQAEGDLKLAARVQRRSNSWRQVRSEAVVECKAGRDVGGPRMGWIHPKQAQLGVPATATATETEWYRVAQEGWITAGSMLSSPVEVQRRSTLQLSENDLPPVNVDSKDCSGSTGRMHKTALPVSDGCPPLFTALAMHALSLTSGQDARAKAVSPEEATQRTRRPPLGTTAAPTPLQPPLLLLPADASALAAAARLLSNVATS
jgi:hypothetical protein